MTKSKLLNKVIEYYLNSGDFNGLPLYEIGDHDIDYIIELINENLIEVLSEDGAFNIHIKGFDLMSPKECQITNVRNVKKQSCLYPTKQALQSAKIDNTTPYTAMLQTGEAQFNVIYFNIEVLERYINNPKYFVTDYGYRGQICIKNEYWNSDEDDEYIKDYGMAYKKVDYIHRAVAVFLRDLSKLSKRVQLLWKSFELENQSQYIVEEGFEKNLIYGAWVTKHWLFNAVLEEMKIINDMCSSIGIPCLFNRTYGTSYNEKPEGYQNILLPTLKNYYEFVSVIEKLIVHNISVKAFTKDATLINSIDRKNEDGTIKGSLTMLKEWLNKNVKAEFDIEALIISPLKDIRKIRQIPAHELYCNKYDISVYEKQKELMQNVYLALKALRHLFMGHPLATNVQVPNYLLEGKDIVFY